MQKQVEAASEGGCKSLNKLFSMIEEAKSTGHSSYGDKELNEIRERIAKGIEKLIAKLVAKGAVPYRYEKVVTNDDEVHAILNSNIFRSSVSE